MFLNHFQLKAHPFTERPPIEWLLTDERFEQALSRMKFFVEQGDIALIIGQTGIGKSSLLRLFIKSLPQNRHHPLYVHLTSITPNSFLRMIVAKLGESPKLGKDKLFLQIIERIRKNETHTVLFIDEAQYIPSQALTDLRLLVSSGLDANLPLKIVLSGQDPLASILKRSRHADLVHRISVRCRLNPLTMTQTGLYLEHRMRCAGASEKIFDPEAKNLTHDYAGGVPRQINNIATACLIQAAAKNLHKIDDNMVNEIMGEFHLA